MHGLVDGAISRSRMVIAILVVSIIAGAITYANLPKEADPDIPIPYVGVTVPLEGVSPEDAERLLVRPLEAELLQVEGLEELNSFAMEGAAQIIMEFGVSFDQDQAVLDVREKVDMAERDFPEDAREPVVTELNAALFPVLVVNLYGDAPERGLYKVARDLQEQLETLSGVLEVNIQGEREEVLEIIVDQAKLESYNLSNAEILQSVTSNNILVAAGRTDMGEGRFSIKLPGLIETAEDAFGIPVKRSGDAVVTLADVADIRRTFKDREVYARFNGRPAVALQVVKRTGANILDTVAEVRAEVDAAQETWPDTVQVAITSDLSELIGAQLGTLQSSIVTAIVLVMIIVVAALGLRSALLVGLSIPASFVLSFLLLAVYGLTINMMVMFGLLIAVGILVDGAIVVVEYADRKMAEGLDKREAYAMASKRMFWPIIASNGTTLAAFVPFLFWDTMPGQFMAFLPLTLIFVLCSSLVMALIFLPVVGTVFGGRSHASSNDMRALSSDGDPTQARGWLGGYVRLIAALIKRPLMVTGVAFAIVGLIVFWFASEDHKSEFFLDTEPEQIYVFVRAQGNLSASEEFEIVRRAEEMIFDVPGIESLYTQSGVGSSRGPSFDGGGDVPADTIGRILVDLDTVSPGSNGHDIEQAIADRLSGFVGGLVEVRKLEQGPPTGKDVQLALQSNDMAALKETAGRLRAFMDTMDGLADIEDTRPLPGIEWRLTVDRAEAAKFGVDVAQVGAAVQLVTNGVLVGRYRPDDANDEVDIRVRFPSADRSVEALDDLRVSTPNGPTPISLFVSREPAPRIAQIDRRGGKRIIEIRANAAEQGRGAVVTAEIKDWIASANLDPNVDILFNGADLDSAEAEAFFVNAAYAALFLMAVILLWEFNNFYHVALTLSAVVLSSVGVLIGINLAQPYISVIMTGTGVVALAGIVVNNNIVLIDTFQRLRADGRTAEQAAIATAAQRIRPILLTTLTTICGLCPMILQINVNFAEGSIMQGGPASEWWVPLATAVVFGLGFSTLLTLVLTPTWLAAPEKLAAWRDRVLGVERSIPDHFATPRRKLAKKLGAVAEEDLRAAE
ncbi:MAG: efflux RND transporter permease subunit [Pseudomonadota bacterium]